MFNTIVYTIVTHNVHSYNPDTPQYLTFTLEAGADTLTATLQTYSLTRGFLHNTALLAANTADLISDEMFTAQYLTLQT